MSTPDAPNPISAHHILAEANKVSWAATGYPSSTITRMEPLDMIHPDIDGSRQLGRDLETGEIQWSDFYDWNTWHIPEIEWAYFQQFSQTKGIRCAVKLNNGDPYRTLVRFIVRENDPTTGAIAFASNYGRWAGEFSNDGGEALNVQYGHPNYPKQLQVCDGTTSWFDSEAFGDYTEDDDMPTPGAIPNPQSSSPYPSVIFSFVSPNIAADNGTTTYYLEIEMYDGRYFDSVSEPVSSNTYVLNDVQTTGSGFNEAREASLYRITEDQDPLYDPNRPRYDSKSGDGGIHLFNDLGDIFIDAQNNTSFSIGIDNRYSYYLLGPNQYYWVYIAEGLKTTATSDNATLPPFFPDSDFNTYSGSYNAHPYDPNSNEYSASDDIDVSDYNIGANGWPFDRWIRIEGADKPLAITGLTTGSNYSVWVMGYRDSDEGRYKAADIIATNDKSAPDPNSSTIYAEQTNTTSNQLYAPTIDAGTFQWQGFDITLDWIDNNSNSQDVDDYDLQYWVEGEGPPEENEGPSVGSWIQTNDWGTIEVNRDNNIWRSDAAFGGPTQEPVGLWVRLKAIDSSGQENPSDWSEAFKCTPT